MKLANKAFCLKVGVFITVIGVAIEAQSLSPPSAILQTELWGRVAS